MKVGLICPYNIFKGGGVQECVKALQHELEARGHRALIITPQPRENSNTTKDGVIFVGGAANVKSFHTTAQVSVSVNTDMVEQVLGEEKFDILHFHEPSVPMVSRQILSRSSCINIATFHAKLPDTLMSRTIEKVITPYTKSILKDLHYLTAVSHPAAEYIESLTDQEVAIIPNGIDLEKFKNRAEIQKSNRPVILYLGRLERRKGVQYLLQAFAELKKEHPEVKLLIAGDGPDRRKLKNLIEQLEIADVEFLGYVEESKKLNLLNSSALFCSPALYGESFGIVLLEAMACGLPVVAGNNPGYAAVLTERGSFSLVNPKDTDDFVRRLKLMLFDGDIRKLWIEWAAEGVKQFGYEKVVAQYESLYEKALKERGQGD
jgi:phosphatidylinositol alpha-mannosyltransferase